MRGGFTLTLIVLLVFTSGYFYYVAEAICPIPLEYRIGELDERFQLSYEEAQLAVTGAGEIWEDATERNLFTYNETADFAVNFIFDERQALANAEDDFKDRLDQTEGVNENISQQYETLVSEYNQLKDEYKEAVVLYEADLDAYNQEVQSYNQNGGAPIEVFERLEQRKVVLDREQGRLNGLSAKLNSLVEDINRVGNEGNRIIETYNRGVDVYNQTFGEVREFTQGDYQGDQINIYTFESKAELELVLVHELGHALNLDHVAGEESAMYYLIGGQPVELDLSLYDLEEFGRVCGDGMDSFFERLRISLGL